MSNIPKIRFIYFGTPRFAEIVLDELKSAGHIPTLIITAPDRPKGRHLELTPSEVRLWGKKEGIRVLTPEKLDKVFMKTLAEEHADLFIVAAYGKILPEELLALPSKGTLNVHPSLLPKFRGASPIESAILSDEKGSGVTIMLMDTELDHGPIITQRSSHVSSWPPKGSLFTEQLAHEGGKLLAETIDFWIAGTTTETAQDHSTATFTTKIKKADGEIDPEGNSILAYKKIRAFDAWPGAFFFVTKKTGERVRVSVKDASCENKTLTILRVIPEGKKEMDYQDFLRGL